MPDEDENAPPGKVAFENDVRPDDDAPPSARPAGGSVLGARCPRRARDGRARVRLERDDAEMSDSDDEVSGGDDGLNGTDLYEILADEGRPPRRSRRRTTRRPSAAPTRTPRRRRVSDVAEGVRLLGDAESARCTTRRACRRRRTLRRKVRSLTSTTGCITRSRGGHRRLLPHLPRRRRRSERHRRRVRQFEGDIQVFMWVMCSEEAIDAHRSADVADAAVERRHPAFPAFGGRRRRANDRRRKSARAAREEEKVEEGRGRG